LGRLPVVVELAALGEDELLQILTLPPDSILREYQELLALDEVRLKVSEDALREVVRYTIRRKTGARGLRSSIEEICHDVMFDAPERRGQNVTIDRDFVLARLSALEDVDFAAE